MKNRRKQGKIFRSLLAVLMLMVMLAISVLQPVFAQNYEAGKKGADGCRQQDPSAASFSQKQFANNAKKNIIHKKIRQKDDVYVYVIIHKKAPCGRQSFTLVSEPIIRSQGAQILSKRDGKS